MRLFGPRSQIDGMGAGGNGRKFGSESSIGKILPSESECVKYFKVSRPTVRQAMAHLFSQGLIARGRGRGTFIAQRHVDYDVGRSI